MNLALSPLVIGFAGLKVGFAAIYPRVNASCVYLDCQLPTATSENDEVSGKSVNALLSPALITIFRASARVIVAFTLNVSFAVLIRPSSAALLTTFACHTSTAASLKSSRVEFSPE